LVDRTLLYIESALTDAKQQGLVAIEDPKVTAKRVHFLVLGNLLHAKIRNQLAELEDLEAAIFDLIRAPRVS